MLMVSVGCPRWSVKLAGPDLRPAFELPSRRRSAPRGHNRQRERRFRGGGRGGETPPQTHPPGGGGRAAPPVLVQSSRTLRFVRLAAVVGGQRGETFLPVVERGTKRQY